MFLTKGLSILSGFPQPSRLKQLTPFIVMEVLERAKQLEKAGEQVIHLGIGEPDFDTPGPVKQAALCALAEGDTHYTHSLGKIELREEIASYYRKEYGVEVSPEQIVVTSGSSPAMLLAFSVLLENGGEVLLPDPYYACYPNFIRYAGGVPAMVPVDEKDGFKYRPAEIKKRMGASTRALIINSPANPTGNVFTAEELQQIAKIDCCIVSDEVYHGLNYTGKDHTILEFTDRAFVVNGFSKKYAMTGWRLGYLIVPPAFMRTVQKMQQNLFISACSFVQSAGIAALREAEPFVKEMVATYNRRRCYVIQKLEELGIAPQVTPSGAFYVLADIREYTADSYRFAFELLEKKKVAVTPGIDFGTSVKGYIRISYANSLENIQEGLARLESFLREKRENN